MPPDLNSLPPSPSPSSTPLQARSSANDPTPTRPIPMSQSPPTSHTPPHSLAAAATMNAGIHNEDMRRQSSGSVRRDVERARRRSSIRMNLNLNDPNIPGPGEMQRSPSSRSRGAPWPHSPHHERTPSLGDLHQEIEMEQEGQVNRLLNMIRQQQAQIVQLQSQQPSASAVDDSTPTSERSMSLPHSVPQNNISPLPAAAPPRAHSPFTLSYRGNISRQSSMADRSRGSSHTGSPALRPTSSHGALHENNDFLPASAIPQRDESAFYQAETQMLTRENQMLKLRIRELERQLSELNPTNPITHSPVTASNLHSSPPLTGRQPPSATVEATEALNSAAGI